MVSCDSPPNTSAREGTAFCSKLTEDMNDRQLNALLVPEGLDVGGPPYQFFLIQFFCIYCSPCLLLYNSNNKIRNLFWSCTYQAFRNPIWHEMLTTSMCDRTELVFNKHFLFITLVKTLNTTVCKKSQ